MGWIQFMCFDDEEGNDEDRARFYKRAFKDTSLTLFLEESTL